MMTKQDFENLAKDLRWFRLATVARVPHEVDFGLGEPQLFEAFDELLKDISRTCKTANPRFNKDKFYEAVYKEKGVSK